MMVDQSMAGRGLDSALKPAGAPTPQHWPTHPGPLRSSEPRISEEIRISVCAYKAARFKRGGAEVSMFRPGLAPLFPFRVLMFCPGRPAGPRCQTTVCAWLWGGLDSQAVACSNSAPGVSGGGTSSGAVGCRTSMQCVADVTSTSSWR